MVFLYLGSQILLALKRCGQPQLIAIMVPKGPRSACSYLKTSFFPEEDPLTGTPQQVGLRPPHPQPDKLRGVRQSLAETALRG